MKKTTLSLILVIVIATVVIAGCTQQPSVQPTPQPTVQPADTIRVSDTLLGKILVDSQGKTLYYFANDIPSSGNSTCYGQCEVIWPVFSSDIVRVSSPLVSSDFSSFTRADGLKQTAYRGWPLYYYQQDPKPGDLNGENVQKVWFVVKPDETVMIAHQGTAGFFLTDKTGKTLYTFTQDTTPGTTACTGACLTKWPAYNGAPVSAPSVLKPADFSAVTRADGVLQTAYMNRPLYYFADDAKPGEVKGQGFNNVWYSANVTGFVPVPTTVPTTLHTLSYGGGY